MKPRRGFTPVAGEEKPGVGKLRKALDKKEKFILEKFLFFLLRKVATERLIKS